MASFHNLQENIDYGRKRKILNNNFEENRKRFKMNYNNSDNILTLSPEKMSASEICFVLQERGSDIEDIRCLLVFRLKKIIGEEKENSKVTTVKDEFIVKEEIVEKEIVGEEIENSKVFTVKEEIIVKEEIVEKEEKHYQDKQTGEYMELDLRTMKTENDIDKFAVEETILDKNTEDSQILQETESLELPPPPPKNDRGRDNRPPKALRSPYYLEVGSEEPVPNKDWQWRIPFSWTSCDKYKDESIENPHSKYYNELAERATNISLAENNNRQGWKRNFDLWARNISTPPPECNCNFKDIKTRSMTTLLHNVQTEIVEYRHKTYCKKQVQQKWCETKQVCQRWTTKK